MRYFETTIGDRAALIASLSDRKDVILYGSGAKGRSVGPASVKATLKKWNLGFTVVDGIRAGVTSSGNVAWVAANLASHRPGDKAVRHKYYVLLLYEKSGDEWRLVHANFGQNIGG